MKTPPFRSYYDRYSLLQMAQHAWIALVIFLVFPSIVFADNNVTVSLDSSFSSETRMVSPGQMMYVRVAANNNGGSKAVLTLKTNTSGTITSYTLTRTAENVFSVSFPAPTQQGTYLLDSEIAENGSSSKSVYSFSVGQGSSLVTSVIKSETSSNSTSVSSQGTTITKDDGDVSVVTISPSTGVSAKSNVTNDTSSTSLVSSSSSLSSPQPSIFARVVSACIYVAEEFINNLF